MSKVSPQNAPPTPPASNILCWNEARLRRAMPEIVGRCMSFSADPLWDTTLEEAIYAFYGVHVDLATAETEILEDDYERIRFYPWFLWDFKGAIGQRIGHSFHTLKSRNPFEKALLQSLSNSHVSFLTVEDRQEDGHILLRDLGYASRPQIVIRDRVLIDHLEVGQVILARLVRPNRTISPTVAWPKYHRAQYGFLDAIYAVLPPTLLPEVLAFLDAHLKDVKGAGRRWALKRLTPKLFEIAESLIENLESPPPLSDPQGEPLFLCSTTLQTPPPAISWDATDGPLLIKHDAHGGRLFWLRQHEAQYHLEAISRDRFTRAKDYLKRHGVKLSPFHAERLPENAFLAWLHGEDEGAWLHDPILLAAFRASTTALIDLWLNAPHPGLGNRSPREAKKSGYRPTTLQAKVDRIITLLGAPYARAVIEGLG